MRNHQVWICSCIIALFACIVKEQARGDTALGALIPLTGSAAEQGEWIRRGLELAALHDEKAFPGGARFVTEDTAADPKNAIAAYRNLRTRYQVPIVFTYGSGVGVALTPIVNTDQVIQIGLATASPAYRTPDDFTFRIFPSAELEAAFLVKAIFEDLKIPELSIVKIQNEYGIGSAKAFRIEYEKRGGKVIAEEAIEANGSDYRATLLRLKGTNSKAYYIAAYPNEGALLLKQARELGITAPFVASVAILGSKDFLNLAGKAAEGLIIGNSAPDFTKSKDPAVRKFVDHYLAHFHVPPGIQDLFAARAYDAMNLSRQALRACASNNTICIRDFLFAVKNYPGASGNVTFDRNGDVESVFSLQQVKAGQFELLQGQ